MGHPGVCGQLVWLLLFLPLLLQPRAGRAELSSRIVRTQYGELSGVIVSLGRSLESVEVFRGVPYASPPIGTLRFMPPVSSARWHGVRVADKFGPVCPQKLPVLTEKMPKGRLDYLRRLLPYLKNQSEDCLYLNIYAPVQGECSILRILRALFHRLEEKRSKLERRLNNATIDPLGSPEPRRYTSPRLADLCFFFRAENTRCFTIVVVAVGKINLGATCRLFQLPMKLWRIAALMLYGNLKEITSAFVGVIKVQ